MNSKFYGQIDLEALWAITKQHNELVIEKTFKDGSKHHYINISVLEKEKPDDFGNTATIRVDSKERKEGLRYFIANLKTSTFKPREAQPRQNFDEPLPPIGEDLFPWEK